ncbi:hypothetical protein PPERSA_00125 [Pseudocohnilembus persalinus]|uniref:Heparan-alpha-glucosaminide N-acetyltransferase catalytic domain-containing protein n=1 Tax=Pseudocohnilembus persalinus TaxID=266149 RepID=A0A0V0Q8J0_PSEPJ|nr:hypothetical protein PPERSA_00125 [Pseudocohnilembus persalinus]|eukprot:KRW98528.1 hypothetical protein PPERSA_00125 [Pseudocohnilembus persalinus]
MKRLYNINDIDSSLLQSDIEKKIIEEQLIIKKSRNQLPSFFEDQEISESENADDIQNEQERIHSSQTSKKVRLKSLDVFRGLTILGMILVDNVGSDQYAIWPLKHSEWDGWTLADQVFPNFLFIMGLAIPLSLRCTIQKYQNNSHCFNGYMKIFSHLGLLINILLQPQML